MIGCPVVCDEVVCLKRVRNYNVNVCDHGDDMSTSHMSSSGDILEMNVEMV